jgi:hypothetical protein
VLSLQAAVRKALRQDESRLKDQSHEIFLIH